MKTTTILKKICVLLILACIGSTAIAQDKKTTKKEAYRIKLIKNENGKKEVIDTTFTSLEDLRKFQKANMTDATDIDFKEIEKHHKQMTESPATTNTDKKNTQRKTIEKRIIKVDGGDTTIHNEVKYFELSSDNKEKLMNAKNTDEVMELLDIDIELDSLYGDGEKEIKMIAIFRQIKVDDAAPKELTQNKHPKMQQAATQEKLTLKKVNVYPNPSSGNVFLDLETLAEGNVELLVTDMQGKEIFSESFFAESNTAMQRNINIDGQKSGVYLLKITSQGKSIVKKLIFE